MTDSSESTSPAQSAAEPTKVHVVVYSTLPIDPTNLIRTQNSIYDRGEIVVETKEPGDLDAARAYALVNVPRALQVRFGYRLKATTIDNGQPVEITSVEVFPKEEKWHSAKYPGMMKWLDPIVRDLDSIVRRPGDIISPKENHRYIQEINYPTHELNHHQDFPDRDRDLRDASWDGPRSSTRLPGIDEIMRRHTIDMSCGVSAFEIIDGPDFSLRKEYVDPGLFSGEITVGEQPAEDSDKGPTDVDLPPGL